MSTASETNRILVRSQQPLKFSFFRCIFAMKFLWLFFLSIYFNTSISLHTMTATQYRRFLHKIKNEEELKKYLDTNQFLMAYAKVINSSTNILMIEGGNLHFEKAVHLLWETPSHSIIFSYADVNTLTQATPEFFNSSETPQVWTHFNLAQGPGGVPVPDNDVESLFENNFEHNRILAVGWTRNHEHDKDAAYTYKQIMQMYTRLENHLHSTLVLILDVIPLSNTPKILKWMPEKMANIAILIRMSDLDRPNSTQHARLVQFVKDHPSAPIFFDLPEHLHKEMLEKVPKLTTVDPLDVNRRSDGWLKKPYLWLMFVELIYLSC